NSRRIISMTKRLVSAAASVAAASAAALALAPSAMAANAGTCTLQGTATFTTPLTLGPAAAPFDYTFNGNLSTCASGTSSSGRNTTPSGGTISTPASVSGDGSCVSSTTGPGIAVVNWNDNNTTVVSYTTTGALAAVAVKGTVLSSATVGGTTYTTNEPSTPVGDTA